MALPPLAPPAPLALLALLALLLAAGSAGAQPAPQPAPQSAPQSGPRFDPQAPIPPAQAPDGAGGRLGLPVEGAPDEMQLDLTPLDLAESFDGERQLVGVRFDGAALPPGTRIASARLWLTVTAPDTEDDPGDDPGGTPERAAPDAPPGDHDEHLHRGHPPAAPAGRTLWLRGQQAAERRAVGPLRGETAATAPLAWPLLPWRFAEARHRERSPELRDLLQALLDAPGRASDDPLVLLLDAPGRPLVASHAAPAAEWPRLQLTLTPPGAPPPTPDASDESEEPPEPGADRPPAQRRLLRCRLDLDHDGRPDLRPACGEVRELERYAALPAGPTADAPMDAMADTPMDATPDGTMDGAMDGTMDGTMDEDPPARSTVETAGTLSARAAPARTATLVAVGDIACDPASDEYAAGAARTGTCREADTAALAAAAAPDVVAVLGDNQYEEGTLEQYRTSYDATWGRFKAITRPAVGNHEYLTEGARGHFEYFGDAAGPPDTGYYAYDLGAWRVLVLNSNCSIVGGCNADSPQLRWLRAELDAHPSRCALAYMHHPRFSSGHNDNNPRVRELWQALVDGGVDVLLVGHDHHYERFAPMRADGRLDHRRGLRQFIVGTGGKNHTKLFEAKRHSEVRHTGDYGVLVMRLEPAAYSWEFQTIDGAEFHDAGRERCR